jgi:hypothetical protein
MFARLVGIDCVACPHVLQTLSDTLETCARALRTYVSNCTDMTAKLFFMLDARGPQGATGYVTAPEPTSIGR